jgi:hypothetical protein
MKLNKKTKEYISYLVSFIGGYETYEDLGIEAMVSIQLMENDKIINDIYFKNALNKYIKKVRKELKGE